MDRIRTRWFVVLASLFAVSILLATTAVAAPTGRPEAGPSNGNQPVVDKKAPVKRTQPARSAGNSRGRSKATGGKSAKGRPSAPSRTAKPRSRAAPSAPKTRPPARRSPPPRRAAPPTRGIQPKRATPPSRRTTRPSAAPRTRSTPQPRTTPPTRRTPGPHITPPNTRRTTPRLWERRRQRDERDTPAPRRRRPDVTVTPIVSDAPNRVVDRPRRDDKPGGSGHGGKYRKHGHHHHAYCGCFLRNWSRLLYGYFDYYGSRYACDPYDYRYGTGTTFITFGTQLPLPGYGPSPCTATGPEAWALLADGQAAAAYQAFACLSPAVPDDGWLLVGLALSAAAIDEHELAVTALRTAMRIDPVSLLDVPGGDRLDLLLSDVADHYDARARAGYGDVDALFMVAALRYLLGQDAIAHYALEIAIALDDVDQSTRNLKGLIEASPADASLRRAQ